MENEKLFLNVKSSSSSSSSSSNRIQSCHLDSNCDTFMDQSTAFKPSLSSLVSSPTSSNTNNPSECIAIRELIGKLGQICNSGQIPPPSHLLQNSSNASFYNSSVNSPSQHKISWVDSQISENLPILGNSINDHQNLELFTSDPRFKGRATRISCYNISNYDQLQGHFVCNEQEFSHKTMLKTGNGNPSRDLINLSIRAGIHMGSLENDSKFQRLSKYSTPENSETDNAREESYISHHPAENQDEINGRKRKAIFRSKVRESPSSFPCIKDDVKKAEEDAIAKRSKISEGKGNPENDINPKEEEEEERSKNTVGERRWKDRSKSVDPPKQDFIHVRARRGQATDSHSLAERIRREKISERMKFLQGLVPGCNKVTGKAVMLDEIINYVQSLQRQVEFLSMKLANINPSLNFNMENLLSKDIQYGGSLQSCPSFTSHLPFPFVQLPEPANFQSIDLNGYDIQSSVHPLDPILSQDLGIQHSSNDIYANPCSQIPGYWEDELQTVVHMGFEQNMNQTFSQQSFNGSCPSTHET